MERTIHFCFDVLVLALVFVAVNGQVVVKKPVATKPAVSVKPKIFPPIFKAGNTYRDCEKQIECAQCKGFRNIRGPRTLDGTCNNLRRKTLGAAQTPLTRVLRADYIDRRDTPRGFPGDRRHIPTAHEVSKAVFDVVNKNKQKTTGLSTIFMTFGQFLDHDISFSPHASCKKPNCRKRSAFKYPCFPIKFTRTGHSCSGFGRSAAVCPKKGRKPGVRHQINAISSFIDGSQIYSNDFKKAQSLRALDGSGRLKVDRKDMLPIFRPASHTDCHNKGGCSLVGDFRADENIALHAMHTIWVRYHNLIAKQLRSRFRKWNEEKIYQRARKITIAVLQKVVYSEFVPFLAKLTPYRRYRPRVNPSIITSFSSAAYRFGHSLVPDSWAIMDKNFNKKTDPVTLQESFFNTKRMRKDGIEGCMFGLLKNQSQECDTTFAHGVARRLFVEKGHHQHADLTALNIQRGRDHGVGSTYPSWRIKCGLSPVRTWADLNRLMPKKTIAKFRKIYKRVTDIDLFAAGVAEFRVRGARKIKVIGPTFQCIIKKQFERLRDGDRFFYRNRNVFTLRQLKQLEKMTFASVLCDTLKGMVSIQKMAFMTGKAIRRNALEGIHVSFMNQRTIYIVTFNLSVYSTLDKVPKWVNTIQAKAPGSYIIIVASHCDLSTEEKTKAACERVMMKIKEQEENNRREIKEELLFLRDLGLFSMIGRKRRHLEWLLEKRPKIHEDVIVLSSITGEGVDELRNLVLSATANHDLFPSYQNSNEFEKLYAKISELKKQDVVMMQLHEIEELAQSIGIRSQNDTKEILKQLEHLGCIMQFKNDDTPSQSCHSLTNGNVNDATAHSDGPTSEITDALVCINPPLFADAIAQIHRNETNVQDLVVFLQRGGHIEFLWTGKTPNDWTLRNAFTNITQDGMIRESIIPLLLYKFKLPLEQFFPIVQAMQYVNVLFSGAPNANYDVELCIPLLKDITIFKRYYLPLQGLLPVIPQINAWLPKCPPTHIQVGWDYRFVSSIPPHLFLTLISACTVVKLNCEIISYWQSGTYIQNGNIGVCVCQWKDKLVLQVLARAKIENSSRQAVNRAWCCLASYLYKIEKILSSLPGLYYEVLAVNNTQCKPILEIIDEYEAGDANDTDVLWYIPLKGCTSRTPAKSNRSLTPKYLSWLKSIAEQGKVYVSHSSEISSELKPLTHYLIAAGYEVTLEGNEQGLTDAKLIICILTEQYFEENRLAAIKVELKDKKILFAVFTKDLLTENRGHEDILLNKSKVDISSGKGSGSSYQPNVEQIKNLIDVCNITLFGHGSLGEEVKRISSINKSSNTNADSPSLTKKPFEQFSDIVQQFSDMTEEAQMKQVAKTAVAAAVATATAEHISKQSNPTMGAKAAAMAAEVADAVAKGDTDRAAKAVIATAKSVDEVVAFSNARQSVGVNQKPNVKAVETTPDQKTRQTTKSSMCVIL